MSSYYEKMLATGEVKCLDEEIPFDVPQGWEWTRIGNIFNHTSGKQQSSSNKSGGTPQKFITTSNLYWGYFVLDNVKVMNFTDEETRNCSATKGDLLVCEGGAGYGRSAIWNEDYDICLQNHVHRLRPCINGICEYVYYFIYLLKESNNLASVGTAMPGLSANRLKGLLLPFPPINEQKRIVSKMEELIPLINRYAKAQQSLDELNQNINEKFKKSCLQEAIQGWPNCPKLSTLLPNQKDVSVENLLEQIKEEKQKLVKEGKLKKSALKDSVIFRGDDNKYYEKTGKSVQCIDEEIPFEIPESWMWVRFEKCIGLLSGRDLEPSQYNDNKRGFPYITGASNFKDGTLYVNRWTNSPITIATKGSLLLTCKGTIGAMAFNNIGAIHIARQVMAIEAYLINLQYIRHYLQFNINALEKNANSMIPGISRNTILKMLFPLPPLAEQKRIVEKVNQLTQLLK